MNALFQNVISVCELLVSVKQLKLLDDTKLDDLRLLFVLRLLKSPHFNARMNGLKEITKMLGDSTSDKGPKTAIPQQKLTDWLLVNKVLSVSLEGWYRESLQKVGTAGGPCSPMGVAV